MILEKLTFFITFAKSAFGTRGEPFFEFPAPVLDSSNSSKNFKSPSQGSSWSALRASLALWALQEASGSRFWTKFGPFWSVLGSIFGTYLRYRAMNQWSNAAMRQWLTESMKQWITAWMKQWINESIHFQGQLKTKFEMHLQGQFQFQFEIHFKGRFKIKLEIHLKGQFQVQCEIHFQGRLQIDLAIHFKGQFEIQFEIGFKGQFPIQLEIHFKGLFQFQFEFHFKGQYKIQLDIHFNGQFQIPFETQCKASLLRFMHGEGTVAESRASGHGYLRYFDSTSGPRPAPRRG